MTDDRCCRCDKPFAGCRYFLGEKGPLCATCFVLLNNVHAMRNEPWTWAGFLWGWFGRFWK